MKKKQLYEYCKKQYLDKHLADCKDEGQKAMLLAYIESAKNNERHLTQQDMLLQIIKKQSKPQFGREVLANITGDFIFEILLRGVSKLFK